MPNLKWLFKTIKCFIQITNPFNSIIKAFRLIDIDLLLNTFIKESSFNIHLFNLKVLCNCNSKKHFIAYGFHNRHKSLIKINSSLLFITLYHPSCLILYNPSFTVPFVLKNPLGIKNFIIKKSINKCSGVVCFIKTNFVFTGRVLFVIINVKGRLFLWLWLIKFSYRRVTKYSIEVFKKKKGLKNGQVLWTLYMD